VATNHVPDDLDDVREYVDWVWEKLDAAELEDLERDAANDFATESPTSDWRRIGLYSKALLARGILMHDDDLSRSQEPHLRRCLVALTREFPWVDADEAWEGFLSDHPELGGDDV
jgi:hypothetical protein